MQARHLTLLLTVIALTMSGAILGWLLRLHVAQDLDPLRVYRAGHDFGAGCEYAVGVWTGVTTFEGVAAAPHIFTPLAMPYRKAPADKQPAVPESGYLLTRCRVPAATTTGLDTAWLSLGMVYGNSAIFLDHQLVLRQTTNRRAEIAVPPPLLGKDLEVAVVARRTPQAVSPGLSSLGPVVVVPSPEAMQAIRLSQVFNYNERPVFHMMLAIALTTIFAVAWIFGIRYTDVAWMIIALAFYAADDFLFYTSGGTLTTGLVDASRVLDFGLSLSIAGFVYAFMRLPHKDLVPGVLLLTGIGLYGTAFLVLSPEMARAIDLRFAVPSAVAAVPFAFTAWLGFKAARPLDPRRQRRVLMFAALSVFAAVLHAVQAAIELSTAVIVVDYAKLALIWAFAGVLGADLVVYHRAFFAERGRRLEEESLKSVLAERLRLGKAVQDLLLPKVLGSEAHGFRYKFFYEPQQEMSGDWVHRVDGADGALVLLMGDVVGKGPQAALIVAVVAAVLAEYEGGAFDLEDMMTRLNRRLFKLFDRHMTTTLAAVEARRDGSVTVYNCGGAGWLLARPGQRSREIARGSLPLGAAAELRFAKETLRLEGDDLLFTYSDGLLEGARGVRKLTRIIERTTPGSLTFDALYLIVQEVGRPLVHDDDKAMLVVSR